jgi:hypothetical protein
MADRDPEPLFVGLTRRVGLRKAFKVLLFITQWGYVYEYLRGPVASVEEYAEWWHLNERNAYREQKLFREAVPGDLNPNRLWEQLQALNPKADEFRASIDEIRRRDLGTPRRRPPDVDETAALIGTLRPAV